MIWVLAQAGNRAGRTGHYLQWWDCGPEWDAVTSILCNPCNAASFFVTGAKLCRIYLRVLFFADLHVSSAVRRPWGCRGRLLSNSLQSERVAEWAIE